MLKYKNTDTNTNTSNPTKDQCVPVQIRKSGFFVRLMSIIYFFCMCQNV